MDVAAVLGDWRAQLQPEARQRIVTKILETLNRHLQVSVPEGLNELGHIAIRFEDKIYSVATSQSDYLRKISMKMLSMETKTTQTFPTNPAMPNAGTVNQNHADPGYIWCLSPTGPHSPGNNTGQSQTNTSAEFPFAGLGQSNIPGIPQGSVNNSMSHGAQPNMHAHPLREVQGRKSGEPVPEKGSPEEPTFSCRSCMEGSRKRQEPSFSCPICMGALASPISTVCGHIFCEVCIMAAIKKRKECPTCRTKLRGRNNIHRVYLPIAD